MKTKKRFYIIITLILMISAAALCSYAYETRMRDISASVVISTTFKLSVDNSNMDFGFINPGSTYELYPGRYYNEITCVSNTGRTWYLKMALLGGIRGSRGHSLVRDNLKWSVDSFDGRGSRQEGWSPFGDTPVLVYTASPEDSRGEPVKVRLKYKLEVPGDASSDNYGTTIVYSMTETP